MELNLSEYANKKICVAVSGGKDSMALLHYLVLHTKEFNITLSALNCDHKIRGEASLRDSAFVRERCSFYNIPLVFFEWTDAVNRTEACARAWRLECYKFATAPETASVSPSYISSGVWSKADAVATAHHLNDNAETVLFNLARGSALSGLTGIRDGEIIHPLIACTREEIDAYIKDNGVPYVEDETNFTLNYTRNKIRLKVLPELEKAVPAAAVNIFRFSRLAAEDEQYFNRIISEKGLINYIVDGFYIKFCYEKVIFRRAVISAVKQTGKRDFTSEHARRLYELQFCGNGKKFEFLGITAVKEEGGIYFKNSAENDNLSAQIDFYAYSGENFYGVPLVIRNYANTDNSNGKLLKFDAETIPRDAVIRFMCAGDVFKKFGGGTKNLGDYFTDLKIPVRVRCNVPLIACGNEVLAVCGVEISDKIKITDKTKTIGCIICADYRK